MNRKMAKTNIEWLPEIPETWKCARVKNLFYISKEQAHEKNPTVLSLARSGVKIRDISNNEGQLAESYFNYNVVKPGDLLLNPMDLYSGANCNMSEVSGVISPAYANLRAKTYLNPKYFDYYFKTQYWSMAMFAHGKGVSFDNRWTLNNDGLMNYELPFPSFAEQNLIVSFLNKKIAQIESLIEIENHQIEKLNFYKREIINEKLSKINKKIKIKYLIDGICDGTHGSYERVTNDGHLLLSAKNLGNDCLIIKENESLVSESDYKEITKNGYPAKNDILMCCVGDIGKTVLYDRDDTLAFQRSVLFLRPSNKIIPEFMLYALRTDDIYSQEEKTMNKTIQAGLYQGIVKELFVPYLSDISLQKKIVESIKDSLMKIDSLIQIKTKKIENLDSYKRSLILDCINGRKEVAL